MKTFFNDTRILLKISVCKYLTIARIVCINYIIDKFKAYSNLLKVKFKDMIYFQYLNNFKSCQHS